VYEIPPASSHRNPENEMEVISGFNAKTIIHPIRMYIITVNRSDLLIKCDFRRIPVIARPHTIPKYVQPSTPLRFIKSIGVYVPAIKRYIDE